MNASMYNISSAPIKRNIYLLFFDIKKTLQKKMCGTKSPYTKQLVSFSQEKERGGGRTALHPWPRWTGMQFGLGNATAPLAVSPPPALSEQPPQKLHRRTNPVTTAVLVLCVRSRPHP